MVFRVMEQPQLDMVFASHVSYRGRFSQTWVRCKARKHAECEISGAEILPGDVVFRPVTNERNRMCRALAFEVEKLTGFDLWYAELEGLAEGKSISVADRDAWFDPFQRGLAPREAISEEYPEGTDESALEKEAVR